MKEGLFTIDRESISTGESSYSIKKRKDGLVSIKAISGISEEILLPKEVGAKVYELMEMQSIAEKHLTDPKHQRMFGDIFTRYFPGVTNEERRSDPVKALQGELTDLNCHWLGRTLL